MVWKSSKFGFQTGGTVREYDRWFTSAKILGAAFCTVSWSPNDWPALDIILQDQIVVDEILCIFPKPDVPYSLNKDSRWKCLNLLTHPAFTTHVNVQVIELQQPIPRAATEENPGSDERRVSSKSYSNSTDDVVNCSKSSRGAPLATLHPPLENKHEFASRRRCKRGDGSKNKLSLQHALDICLKCGEYVCVKCSDTNCVGPVGRKHCPTDLNDDEQVPTVSYQITRHVPKLHRLRKHHSSIRTREKPPRTKHSKANRRERWNECNAWRESLPEFERTSHDQLCTLEEFRQHQSYGQMEEVQHIRATAKMAAVVTPILGMQAIPSTLDVRQWLMNGDVHALEQLVLFGFGYMLERYSNDNASYVIVKDLTLPQFRETAEKSRNIKNKFAEFHFMAAEKSGDIKTVRKLAGYKKVLWARHPGTSATVLHLAVLYQQNTVLRYLVHLFGRHINVPDGDNRTALHYAACLQDRGALYDYLKRCGANEHVKDSNGNTPLQYHLNPELLGISLLRNRSSFTSPSASSGESGIGASRSSMSSGLSEEENAQIIQWIEESKVADLEHLIIGGKWRFLESKQFLFQNNQLYMDLLNLHTKICQIHEKIRQGSDYAVKELIDRRPLFMARDVDGATPLHTAVMARQINLVRYLVRMYPLALQSKDEAGLTPLHHAALLQDGEDIYSLLLNYGADATAPDKAGLTPDDYRKEALSAAEALPRPATQVRDPEGSGRNVHFNSVVQARSSSSRTTVDNNLSTRAVSSSVASAPDEEDESDLAVPPPESPEIPIGLRLSPPASPPTSRSQFSEDVSQTELPEPLRGDIDIGTTMDEDRQINTPDPTEAEIKSWIESQDYEKLEELVLRGKAERLLSAHARKYQEVAQFLQSVAVNNKKLDEVRRAIEAGDLRQVRSLVDRKKLALARGKQGQTLLQIALQSKQADIAAYLIQKYPDCVNIEDKDKKNSLHYAALHFGRNSDIYEQLVDAGANADARDRHGQLPLDYASSPQAPGSAAQAGGSISDLDAPFLTDAVFGDPDYYVADEQIDQWLVAGNVEALEEMVLNGQGERLTGKTSESVDTEEFLKLLPKYQSTISAIHRAVAEGDVRRVKSLIDRKPLALARDHKGSTPIHTAVLHGQTDTLRYLLQKFSQFVNATDATGRTPLHYASADRNGGHYIKLLQKAGADAFIEDKFGHTPFYYRSHPEEFSLKTLKDDSIMEQLLLGEAPHTLLQDLEEDINKWLESGDVGKLEDLVLNGYGDLLLGKVTEADNPDVIRFLEILPQYQAKLTAIQRAVKQGSLRELRALIDRKKLVLARDKKGATPLHNAVLFEHEDIVKYFIKNYPQAMDAQDHAKRTPLHYAAALNDDNKLYNLLRKAKASTGVLDTRGKSPKHYLSYPAELNLEQLRQGGDGGQSRELQKRVAPSYLEMNIQQWLKEGNVGKLEQLVISGCGDLLQGRPATHPESVKFLGTLEDYLSKIDQIHRAVKEGSTRRVKELVDKKRLAVVRDRKGATPLHDAVLYSQTEIVRFLIQSYPNALNAPDYNRRTPLHYAAASRDGGHLYKILTKAGADNTLADSEGHTPEYYLKNPGRLSLQSIRDKDFDYFIDIDVAISPRDESNESNASISTATGEYGNPSLSRQTTLNSLITGTDMPGLPQPEASNTMVDARAALSAALLEKIKQNSSRFARFKPVTATGKYLADAVGPVLAKGLAELVVKRPLDPIDYLADWLIEQAQQGSSRTSEMGTVEEQI